MLASTLEAGEPLGMGEVAEAEKMLQSHEEQVRADLRTLPHHFHRFCVHGDAAPLQQHGAVPHFSKGV